MGGGVKGKENCECEGVGREVWGCWGRERFECGGAGEGRGGAWGRAMARWRPKTAVKEK